MDTKNALQILEQLRQMPNVPEQTRQSLVKYPIYSPRVESELCVADETLSKVHVYYVSSEPMDIDV